MKKFLVALIATAVLFAAPAMADETERAEIDLFVLPEIVVNGQGSDGLVGAGVGRHFLGDLYVAVSVTGELGGGRLAEPDYNGHVGFRFDAGRLQVTPFVTRELSGEDDTRAEGYGLTVGNEALFFIYSHVERDSEQEQAFGVGFRF